MLYVTECCVFRLRADGLELTEIAPGIDLQRDILDRMDFAPAISELRTMDARIFADAPMGLREQLVGLPFDARFSYDAAQNTLFINFERFEVRTLATVQQIERQVEALCAPLGRRVRAIVNYEGFVLDREVEDAWAQSVARIVERWYEGVTRYTTSAFLRAKLGEALARRKVAAHVFETADEARAALREGSA